MRGSGAYGVVCEGQWCIWCVSGMLGAVVHVVHVVREWYAWGSSALGAVMHMHGV
jgi:hypothetical protein